MLDAEDKQFFDDYTYEYQPKAKRVQPRRNTVILSKR